MPKPTAVVLFAGGGGASLGLQQAGFDLVGAVEYDEAICQCYADNVSPHIIHGRVEDQDYSQFEGIDIAEVSPSCVRASVANVGAGEAEQDISAAMACVKLIVQARPRCFLLENVWMYRKFEAFKLICEALTEHGYKYDYSHVDMSHYAVPQSRKRLILRASRVDAEPLLPNKHPRVIGWYEAIEDYIPGLKESRFAPWQIKRLERMNMDTTLFCGMANTSRKVTQLSSGEPSATVVGNWGHRPSHMPFAFLADDSNGKVLKDGGRELALFPREAASQTITSSNAAHPMRAFLCPAGGNDTLDISRSADEPTLTVMGNCAGRIKALVLGVTEQPTLFDMAPQTSMEWLKHGRVVVLDMPCLKRLQTFPDGYRLPSSLKLAATIVGNALPCEFIRQLAERIINHD